jgi:hypothetical protein
LDGRSPTTVATAAVSDSAEARHPSVSVPGVNAEERRAAGDVERAGEHDAAHQPPAGPGGSSGGASGWRRHRGWLIRQAAAWALLVVVLRFAIVPGESCPPVGAPAVQRAIGEGAAWLVRGQRDDGRFLYGYDSSRDEVSSAYNSTRHAGVMDALYRLGRIRAADAGLRYVRASLIRHDGWAAFAPGGEDANVGGNALVVVALMHRRQVTHDERFDGLARRLGRFLLAQERDDGSILQFWRPATGRSLPGVFGKFATGEAFYALALLRVAFPEEGWEEPAHRVAGYLATRRDQSEGYSVRQADHWAAYGLEALAPAGLTGVEAGYARFLAGYFGFLVRLDSQWTGRPLNPFSESGASLGTVGEATGALRRLAGEDARLADLRDELGERNGCLTGILVDRQVGPESPNPRARGAWFADGYTQMDDQQHAVAALLGSGAVGG